MRADVTFGRLRVLINEGWLLSERFDQDENDGTVNSPPKSSDEKDQMILANSSEVYEEDGTIYVDFRHVDPMQLEGVASTGQADGPQQSAVKGRLVYRAAISPDVLMNLDQQLQKAIADLRRASEIGRKGKSLKGDLQ